MTEFKPGDIVELTTEIGGNDFCRWFHVGSRFRVMRQWRGAVDAEPIRNGSIVYGIPTGKLRLYGVDLEGAKQ